MYFLIIILLILVFIYLFTIPKDDIVANTNTNANIDLKTTNNTVAPIVQKDIVNPPVVIPIMDSSLVALANEADAPALIFTDKKLPAEPTGSNFVYQGCFLDSGINKTSTILATSFGGPMNTVQCRNRAILNGANSFGIKNDSDYGSSNNAGTCVVGNLTDAQIDTLKEAECVVNRNEYYMGGVNSLALYKNQIN